MGTRVAGEVIPARLASFAETIPVRLASFAETIPVRLASFAELSARGNDFHTSRSRDQCWRNLPGVTNSPPSPGPDEGVTELLGMLAYGEMLAFDRMTADARLAPDLRRRAILSEMAAAEIGHLRRLMNRLTELGAEPEQAMVPYVQPLQAYHDETVPSDWLEALTKAYVGDGVADDFFREVAAFLGEPDRTLVREVVHASQYAEFAATEIRAAIDVDPKVANRLSMWARRLVGEALSQAQRVAAERIALTVLIVTGSGDQEAVQALLKRLAQAHSARMGAVGLNN